MYVVSKDITVNENHTGGEGNGPTRSLWIDAGSKNLKGTNFQDSWEFSIDPY
jgi:hypothetical protein